MKFTKIFLSFLFIFSQYFSTFANDIIDKKIFNIINGVYEVKSWFDGKKLYKYPEVSGRWTFYEGQVISIIHNRINPENHKSSVRWGKGEVKDKKFKYTYTESLNIKGNEKFSTFNAKLLFEGMRSFDVFLNNNEIKMVSKNKNQIWIINEKGMVYNDKEWGEDKIFVERKWKRLTPIE